MYCNYKIYYNDSFVLITNDRSQINKNFARVIDSQVEIDKFLGDPHILFDKQTNDPILVICEKPGENMCGFMDHIGLEIVVAGGGIISNERDEILMIFRRGKWDLPKGKINLKEKIIDGAVREVLEETGISIKHVSEKPIITYHAYIMKGRNCLKETSWFKMKAYEGQSKPTPQTEEDIEEARWVKRDDIINYKDECYLLIWDLLANYLATSAPQTA